LVITLAFVFELCFFALDVIGDVVPTYVAFDIDFVTELWIMIDRYLCSVVLTSWADRCW
jgi:hypothetical protein